MKNGVKTKISNSVSGNDKLNKAAISLRNSWDEVESILKNVNKPKKK